jgi:hypothetical protein
MPSYHQYTLFTSLGSGIAQVCHAVHNTNCSGKEETVFHFLMACPRYAMHRRALHVSLPRKLHSIAKLLSHPDSIRPMLKFVLSTRRLTSTPGQSTNNK